MAAKMLVAYFSASGTTARIARQVAEAVGADLYEIKADPVYTAADLDWHDRRSRSSIEMNDDTCRPPIADALPDMGGYGTVFLGFPIWWYVEPRIIDTFVEGVDLAGARVVPFATSGGSGISGAEDRMKKLCPAAVWERGRMLNGGDAASWARSVRA